MDSNFPGITIAGLGPGDPAMLTVQVLEWLSRQDEIYTSSPGHPALDVLPEIVKRHRRSTARSDGKQPDEYRPGHGRAGS